MYGRFAESVGAVRPDRLITEIVTDPHRPVAWKIFDAALLTVLWVGLPVVIVVGWNTNTFVLLRFWIPLTILASARSWYLHPRRRGAGA